MATTSPSGLISIGDGAPNGALSNCPVTNRIESCSASASSRRNGIRDTDNRLLETGVRITVEARLERLAPGDTEREVLRRIEVQDERGYALSVSGGETEARARALRYIADRVVIDLFADLAWDAP